MLDADILFVVPITDDKNGNSQKMVEQLIKQPLWKKLKVVQQDKVYVIGEHWLIGSYFSANRVLDDIFRYLVKEQ
ncbi:MAG: hypothetical protein PUP91_12425 [Rhizonema sp. PD37]|nr:hypothetical protein [Rhizonema sp. PD37]